MSNKNLTLGLLVAIVIALVGCFLPKLPAKFGTISATDVTATRYTQLLVDNGIQVTANGINIVAGGLTVGTGASTISGLNFGTCSIRPYAATIAASTTAQVDCQGTQNFASGPGSALPGITAADNIQANLGTSTQGTLYGGLRLRTEIGSSTPGFITLFLENDTGATYTWSLTSNASGTAQYIATR